MTNVFIVNRLILCIYISSHVVIFQLYYKNKNENNNTEHLS